MTDARRRTALLAALALTGSLAAAAVYVADHPIPVVLMLHSITDELEPGSPDISPARFHAAVAAFGGRAKPAVEFTTDRSDASVYSEFYRTLRAGGATGTIFLLPLEIGRPGSLSWDQVREMDRAGFRIGSHSLTHPWLADLEDGEVRCEACYSKALIESKLGHSITSFAYPYGAFDARVRRIVEGCGYSRAYATAPGRRQPDADPLAIKRVYFNEATASSSILTKLAISGYYVTLRELLLSALAVKVPRKPAGWSRKGWRDAVRRERGIDRANASCRSMP